MCLTRPLLLLASPELRSLSLNRSAPMMTSTFSIRAAARLLVLLVLLLGVGILVFVSSSWPAFEKQGEWTTGKQSSEALAITNHKSISAKLAHGDNGIKSAGRRRSLLQRDTPFGWPPPGRNPKSVPPCPECLLHHSDSVEP